MDSLVDKALEISGRAQIKPPPRIVLVVRDIVSRSCGVSKAVGTWTTFMPPFKHDCTL